MSIITPEMHDRLERYAALLKKWNTKINLVSRETISDLWNRHIMDCAQLTELIPGEAKNSVDLGSGAGLPGLILAILLPQVSVTLVERDQRKCAFLLEASRQLALPNILVRNVDISTIDTTFEVITARALASLSELCALAYPLCGLRTICYFPKGKNFVTEIAEAKKYWTFELESFPSKISDSSVTLCLSNLSHLK